MQCKRCGKDLGESTRCSFCGYENNEGNVRELSGVEKNFYDGVTIDEGDINNKDSSAGNSYDSQNYSGFSRRTVYISDNSSIFSRLFDKLINGLINNSKIAKIAVTLIVIAISALMFFVAIPILFVMLALGIAFFTFSKLGR